jgi:hypothetical protein
MNRTIRRLDIEPQDRSTEKSRLKELPPPSVREQHIRDEEATSLAMTKTNLNVTVVFRRAG